MIQRIQTLYLFIVTILQLTSVLWIRDRLLFSGKNVDLLSHYILLIPTILLVVIPFWNIFQFKNRKGQFVVNRLLLLLSLLLMGNQLLGYMNIETYSQDHIYKIIKSVSLFEHFPIFIPRAPHFLSATNMCNSKGKTSIKKA